MSVSSRRARSLFTVALAGLLGSMSLGAAPVDIIRDCAAKAPAGVSGVKDLNSACPGLEDALRVLGLDEMLYDGWRERLNRDSLRDVAQLVDGYGGSTPAAPPDVSALTGVLKALAGEQTPHLESWWDAFKAWLGTWLRSHDSDSLSWLDHLLERLRQSMTVLNAILYSLIGLVLLAAAWVVVNELKAAGLIAGRNQPAPATPGTKAAAGVALMDSEPMALADHLSVLLRLLVNRLMQTGRLVTERSLTHRELVLHSTFDSEAQRAVFAAVAGSAESILYGARSAAPEHLQSVLQQGQALLAELPNSSSAR